MNAPVPQMISVIIPLYNGADTIAGVLAALAGQTTARQFEIIVVDDQSNDGGDRLVRPPVRLLHQQNAGPAAARNHGARQANGDLLLFLDSDCTPTPNWVEDMARAIETSGFDAVMGTLIAANDGVVPRLVQLEVEDRYRGMAAASDGVDFIAAPSCGVKRDVFTQLGGFDERLRQAEDVEFAYRLTAAGHKIAFVQTAPVAHAHQTTWRAFLKTKYVRAAGRLRVFRLFPQKRRQDTWTPLSFKLQFAAVALSVPALLLALVLGGVWWAILVALIMAAILLGAPLVLATARRQRDLIGFVPGLFVGAGFVLIRSAIILAAMLRSKLPRFPDRKNGGAGSP